MKSFIHTYALCKQCHSDKTHHHKCTFHCLRMKHWPHTGQMDLGYSCCRLIFLINHPDILCQIDQSNPEYESYNIRQNHYNFAHKYALVQTTVTSAVETENVRQDHQGLQTARCINRLKSKVSQYSATCF